MLFCAWFGGDAPGGGAGVLTGADALMAGSTYLY